MEPVDAAKEYNQSKKACKRPAFSLHYFNLLLTANKRAEMAFNTLVVGRLQKEYGDELTYCGAGPNHNVFEELCSHYGLKLEVVDREDFIGFANT